MKDIAKNISQMKPNIFFRMQNPIIMNLFIRTQTEALGGTHCDYWYVGDKSPVLKEYEGLKKI